VQSETVGVALAPTLVSRLGQHGRRNALSLGVGITRADRIGAALEAREIGLDPAAHAALPEHLRKLLEWRASAGAYVSDRLPADRLDLAKRAAEAEGDGRRRLTPSARRGSPAIVPAVGPPPPGSRDVRPLRPYADSR
jgi:hypothetical protein